MAIFDLQLPNATTWVYFSFILAIAVYFQFTKPFIARNRDLIGLFFFAPGFLHLQHAHTLVAQNDSVEYLESADTERTLAYTWLLVASFLWFLRCLLDFVMTRRPTVIPNLSIPAIVWFGSALLAGHVGSAILRPVDPWEPVGRKSMAVVSVESGAAALGAAASGQSVGVTKVIAAATLGAAGHLAVIFGLWWIGARHFQSRATGIAMAFAYVLVPYTGFQFGAFHLALPAALIVWALCSFRSVARAGSLLGLASGMAFFPALLLPAWLQHYRGRGATRFALWFLIGLIVGMGLTVLGLWVIGKSPAAAWQAANPGDWIPWKRPESESIWTGVHWAYRLPLFVLYAAFVGGTSVWPSCRDFGQLVATSAAILLGLQFWFADQGGVYVLWYLPLLLVMTFRPSSVDLQPPADPGRSWFSRFRRKPVQPI